MFLRAVLLEMMVRLGRWAVMVLAAQQLMVVPVRAQITDISNTELDEQLRISNFYVVELEGVDKGRDYFNVTWTDLNTVQAMGRLYVQLAAGYYETREQFIWINQTSVYTAGNFSYYDKITGLRPSTWYKLCYKATHIIGQYGIDAAICVYKKTLDEGGNDDSNVVVYTKTTTSEQIVVDVRVLLTPFNISAVGAFLRRVTSRFPITTRSVLVTDAGYRRIYSFLNLRAQTVYEVCVWAENNRLGGGAENYQNDTDCSHAYTIPESAGGTGEDTTQGTGANGGGDLQDLSGGDNEKINIAGVGPVRNSGSAGGSGNGSCGLHNATSNKMVEVLLLGFIVTFLKRLF